VTRIVLAVANRVERTATSVEQAPSGTAALFGEEWPRAERYAALLCTAGVEAGVIGPRETEKIFSRHLRNSLAVAPFLARGSSVVDIGSGAGLPGIPLALARPDLEIVLLEPLERRVRFLTMVVSELNLSVAVVRGRAEAADLTVSAAVARAVAPLPRLLPMARSVLAEPGHLIALKGSAAHDEVRSVQQMTARPHWMPSELRVLDATWPDPATVVVASWTVASGQDEA
jgi:16S rRNA (guanine527-N7)-methyltransferase